MAGALTATGAVTTTAHADTTKASAAVQEVASTDQQLTNLKSQQTAHESAVASSNAATMSAATTSANSQIADLNNQIKARQASDDVAQQNKIDQVNKDAQAATNAENGAYSSAVAKQKAANDTELKVAQAKVVTEQQKNQETAQENTDYQKQADNLYSEHNTALNKLDQDLKNNTDSTNIAIQKEVERQKAIQQAAIDRTTKQFDNQIADANSAVNHAQNAVNDVQQDVNAKNVANTAAQQAVKNAQETLNSAQETLKQAEDNQPVVNTINAPAEYINVWKEYLQTKKPGGWTLSKSDYPDLYARLQKAEQEAIKQSNYQEDPAAAQIKVTLNPNGTLSRDDVIFATQYAASLINPIREAIGTTPYKITNASIDVAQEVENGYRDDNWNTWDNGHDNDRLGQIAKNWGTSMVGESWAGDMNFGKLNYDSNTQKWTHDYSNLTRNDLQRGIYNSIKLLLFECENENSTSSNGHTTDLLGVRDANSHALVGGDILGVSFDYGQGMESAGQVNVGGFHFDSLIDGNSERTKQMHADGGIFKSGSSADKTIQGSNYDQITIPSSEDIIKEYRNKINNLQATVNADMQTLNDAKVEVNTIASELKSAQDKLASDQAKLSQAQAHVNDLRAKKESTLKAMVTDPMQSPEVKKLQAKLDQARVDHDNGVKVEEDQYAAKTKDLKTKHEAKLAEIAAQPTSLAELQSQLQAKLDTLKANHDAKLKQITDDANAKITAIKNQKVDDPEIDKLQAQIDQIKSDLAKKQQELDSQYEALKTKNQAEYDALANKLNPSTKALANGSTQQVFTSRSGKVAYVVPSQQSIATNSVKTNSNSDFNELLSKESNNDTNRLPQTGNKSSLAMVLLGAAAAMFGIGLAGKKRMY